MIFDVFPLIITSFQFLIPSGIAIECQSERSQIQNRAKAMQRLRAKLFELEINKQESDTRSSRKKQVRTFSSLFMETLKTHFRSAPVYALKKSALLIFLKIELLTTELEKMCTTLRSSCLVARCFQSLTKNYTRGNDKKSFKRFWHRSAS